MKKSFLAIKEKIIAGLSNSLFIFLILSTGLISGTSEKYRFIHSQYFLALPACVAVFHSTGLVNLKHR